jgi:GNAT superfamily N-acetyltransferase
MQPAENPLLVFVSSVQRPSLEAERAATIQEISSIALTRPWAFEETPASSQNVRRSYLAKVEECDIFVMIVGSEVSRAVLDEWELATKLGKPRLVFLKRIELSSKVQGWLATVDVKYDRFNSADELRLRVRSAVIDEIVRRYRDYHIENRDYDSLAKTIRSSPISFVVRTIGPGDLSLLSEQFPQLSELYPDLEDWLDKKRVEILHGEAEAYVSSSFEGQSAGFALVTDKGSGVQKLSTLYVLPEYQGFGVGPRLLFDVINKAARDGCDKLYVTVSEERRSELEPLLSHYGFHVEGVSGRRYRERSWEWVWSKRLLHGVVDVSSLAQFAREMLLDERGLEWQPVTPRASLAHDRYGELGLGWQSGKPFVLYACDDDDVETGYEEACALAQWLDTGLVFVGVSSPALHRSDDLIIDAYELETMFFPLFVRRPVSGLILSIRQAFARELIPTTQQAQFLPPTRTQLRTDNVYYRRADQFQELQRGSPLFFYETNRKGADSRMIGEAKLHEFAVDEPRELFARYGNLGVYTLDDLEATADAGQGERSGKALALKFDWYREFEGGLTLATVQAIMPKYNPTTARRIDVDTAMAMREAAGWNVSELSFQ